MALRLGSGRVRYLPDEARLIKWQGYRRHGEGSAMSMRSSANSEIELHAGFQFAERGEAPSDYEKPVVKQTASPI